MQDLRSAVLPPLKEIKPISKKYTDKSTEITKRTFHNTNNSLVFITRNKVIEIQNDGLHQQFFNNKYKKIKLKVKSEPLGNKSNVSIKFEPFLCDVEGNKKQKNESRNAKQKKIKKIIVKKGIKFDKGKEGCSRRSVVEDDFDFNKKKVIDKIDKKYKGQLNRSGPDIKFKEMSKFSSVINNEFIKNKVLLM